MTNHPNRSNFIDQRPTVAFPNPYTWRRLRDASREVWVLINPFGLTVAQVDDEDGQWVYRHHDGPEFKSLAADFERARNMAEFAVMTRRTSIPQNNWY